MPDQRRIAYFSMEIGLDVEIPTYSEGLGILAGDTIRAAALALSLSHYVNGVAKRHGEVSRPMFARYTTDSITNGIHAAT